MNFGDIIRQWSYLERITDIMHGSQCYQDFNNARTLFYISSAWESDYPAATGIDTRYGGMLIGFNTIDGGMSIVPLNSD